MTDDWEPKPMVQVRSSAEMMIVNMMQHAVPYDLLIHSSHSMPDEVHACTGHGIVVVRANIGS